QGLGVAVSERGDRAVIEIAGVGPLLALFTIHAAVGRLVGYRCAVLREAAFDADAVGDLLDRVIGHRLMRDAAMPGWAGALHAVAAQRPRLGDVLLHVELGVVVDGFACLERQTSDLDQCYSYLDALETTAVGAFGYLEESVAQKLRGRFAPQSNDGGVVENLHDALVVVPCV